MTTVPSLSIIVPAYNVEQFIDTGLAAIALQLLPRHQLIVIDDGSSDTTPARIAALQARHGGTNFLFARQSNQGVSCARNHGLALATGDYIMFIDSDDQLLPGALAAIEDVIASHHPDVVACDFRMWNPHKPSKNRTLRCAYPAGQLIADRDLIMDVFFSDRDLYIWTKVFRREVYARQHTPLFPPGRVFEDVMVVPQLLASCASLVYLPLAIIDYRQHPVSITYTVSEQWCHDFSAALHTARKTLAGHALGDSVRMQFDVTVCYFYIGVVKNSYQLRYATGQRVRAAIKASLADSLFHPLATVLAAMDSGTLRSKSPKADRVVARQVRAAVDGSLGFHLAQALNRKLKSWRRQRLIKAQA